MRLSVVLRQPAPRDRTEKCAMIPMARFEQFDIDRVLREIPQAPLFLAERLGKANTRRRQLFKYLEKHHEEIALYVDKNIQDRPTGDQPESKLHGVGPRDDRDGFKTAAMNSDSDTTVTDGNGGSEAHLTIPAPPKSAEPLGENPFLCCYCYSLINPSTTKSWEYVLSSSGKVLCLRII